MNRLSPNFLSAPSGRFSNVSSRPWPTGLLVRCLAAGFLAASTLAFAQPPSSPAEAQQSSSQEDAQQQPAPQDNGQPENGWPAAGTQDGNVAQPAPMPQPPAYGQPGPYSQSSPNAPRYGSPAGNAPGAYGNNQNPYGPGPSGPAPYGQAGQPPYGQPSYRQQAPPPAPAELTVAPGSYVTVRLNQQLSSSRNRNGDAFTATLAEPVVVNGVVIAEPGQTVGGVVADAEKSNPARLVVQLTELSLVDGQRLPIQTKLVARRGPGFNGQDAGTIIGTTAIGAGIGAAADWGTGAAVGAGVGALVGALVTHNHPSVLYPEQMLTFRIDTPATVSTQNAPQAFRYVEPGEYDRPPYQGQGPLVRPAPVTTVYYGAYGYPYGWGYPYNYWGPGVGLYFGSGFYGRGYYGRSYYGGHFYGGRGGYRR